MYLFYFILCDMPIHKIRGERDRRTVLSGGGGVEVAHALQNSFPICQFCQFVVFHKCPNLLL